MKKKMVTALLAVSMLAGLSAVNVMAADDDTITVGFSQEAIRTGERAGFGLAAVAERIALYYGPGYGMTISSKEGEGTTVELRLGKNIQPKS